MSDKKNAITAKELIKRGEFINQGRKVTGDIPQFAFDCVYHAVNHAQNSMDIFTNWIRAFPVFSGADRATVNHIIKRVFKFTPTCARITVITEDHEGTKETREFETRDVKKLWALDGRLLEFKIVTDRSLKAEKGGKWDLLGLQALVHAQSRYDEAKDKGEDLSEFAMIDIFWSDAQSRGGEPKLLDFQRALAVLRERAPKFIKKEVEKGHAADGSEPMLIALLAEFQSRMSQGDWAEAVRKRMEEQERTGEGIEM